MLDIDHFKKVNDTYSHPLGDRVIAAVGQSIRVADWLQSAEGSSVAAGAG